MTYTIWLTICFLLLTLAFALMFARKPIAIWLAHHPRVSKILALIVAIFMMALAIIPILIIAFHSAG